MLFELVKNSLRAVQERFQDADYESPPIRVVVADGVEDVTIKVSLVLLMQAHLYLGHFRAIDVVWGAFLAFLL